ncbi:aspartic peptidase domain-containing protein [Massariosphaeria phaeospora]|uniref:Probable aspartic-type endopeptidase OPSB n=1 Tax=Massariosphaeria phaeospora TaxID=100035 RepID=A0A7C8MH47_9PLEO|nr:aspartic peptidase domain-containing protein [Massariosphaeria phaeospora]
MKYSTCLLFAQLVTSAFAFKLTKRENPKVVGLDIQRRHVANPITHDRLRKRQKTVQQTLDNLETLYFANATLGTPEQNFRLHIDTGSSDLWVNAANSRLCQGDEDPCSISGTYDANSSSTYKFVNKDFNISYVDGSGASGDYVSDTFRFGGQTIEDLQFGVGYTSSSKQGILGIGYTANEVQVNRARGQAYPNLPQKLKDNGEINANAYSIWLNDLDASTGSILFGGVDTAKYNGQLGKLPIIPVQEGLFAEFVIVMTGLGSNGNKGSIFNNQNVAVLLDTGSSLMYLPDNVVRALYSSYNAQYDPQQGAAFVDCSLRNQQGSLDFSFSELTISVPYNELVLEAGTTSRGEVVCMLGIGPSGESTVVLGDTFLRSAYVVYDLENNQIGLAQTNFNATDSSVSEIQSGEDGVPNASAVRNAVTAISVAPGGGRIAGPTINPTAAIMISTASSSGAAMPAITAHPWLAPAGAAIAGAGIMMGFNGF